MTTKSEVWHSGSNASKYFVSILFALFSGLSIVLFTLRIGKTFLRRALGHVEVLWRQIRLAKLLHQFQALGFRIHIESRATIPEIVPILRDTIKGIASTKLPVALSHVALADHRLRIPLLANMYIFFRRIC